MSSVLKALKKTEKKSYNKNTAVNIFPVDNDLLDITGMIKKYSKLGALISGLFCVATGVFFAMLYSDDKTYHAVQDNNQMVSKKSNPEISLGIVKKDAVKQVYNNYAEKSTEVFFDIKDKTWLKLQGISWDQLPEKRIAVVNNAIVREGSTVKNGSVYRIGKDRVIIMSGNRKWILKFDSY